VRRRTACPRVQGIGLGLGVSNLTRMTVVKLKGGGLFVYGELVRPRRDRAED